MKTRNTLLAILIGLFVWVSVAQYRNNRQQKIDAMGNGVDFTMHIVSQILSAQAVNDSTTTELTLQYSKDTVTYILSTKKITNAYYNNRQRK